MRSASQLRWRGAFLISALFAMGAPALASADETLFFNGVVWTGDAARPRAEAVLTRDRRILYVGDNDEAARRASKEARRIDLRGRALLPGFVESHSHPAVAGLLNSKLSVIGTRTIAEVQAALKSYAEAHPDEKVLFGFGFPSALNTQINKAGVKGPHREDLDKIVSDRPVMLIALDAHSAWLNSEALKVGGITKETPDPLPGVHYYQRDKKGEPTGWMVEGGAFWPLLPRFGVGSEEDFRAAFASILPRLSAMGITSVFDAGIPGGDSLVENALKALRAMEKDGKLPMRYHASLYLNDRARDGGEMAESILKMRRRYASDLIDIRTAKIPQDGTIEGETAALLTPYASGGAGAVLLEAKPLSRLLEAMMRASLDVHIHAIGDRASRVSLDAIAAARKSLSGSSRSQSLLTLAHAMLIAPEDLRRLKALDVTIQTTPHWAHDLSGTLALYSKLMDEERGARVMLLRDLWEAAPIVAFASDYPATGLPFLEAAPLYGIEIGMTRRAPGETEAAPLPPADQRMALEQLLKGYTLQGARQLRLEGEIGTIAPGKYADLIVLSRDIFREAPHRIHAIQVDMTMMGGRVVHRREGFGD